jgi:hypothetical protein
VSAIIKEKGYAFPVWLFIPAAVVMGFGLNPLPSPTHQYLQLSIRLANYELICY